MWQPQQRKKKQSVETRTTASTTESILYTTSSMMLSRKSTRFHLNTEENFLGHSSLRITFFNDHALVDFELLFSVLSTTTSLVSLFSMPICVVVILYMLMNMCMYWMREEGESEMVVRWYIYKWLVLSFGFFIKKVVQLAELVKGLLADVV